MTKTTGTDRVISFDLEQARSVERMYLTPDVVRQRGITLDSLAAKPDEKILDIGVGPGLLLRDIAMLVGPLGRACGIDVSDAMVTMAQTRVADLAQAECKLGNATALPYPDGYFDAVVTTQVLEYVDDIDLALSEINRVLRPGGRCVIVDTDWNSVVMNTATPERLEKMMRVWDRHLVHPFLPSRLPQNLRRAKFDLMAAQIIPMLQVGWQGHGYIGHMLPAIINFIRGNLDGMSLDEDQVNAFVNEQEKLKENGGFFFSVNRYQFFAVKAS
jgi:arsenite methyltransferase